MVKLTLPATGGGPKGYTEMGKWTIPENFGVMIKYLEASFKGQEYKPGIWDCEDMVFYGVAKARCAFPGCAIGAALRGEKKGEAGHAQIILWDTGPNPQYVYCDPANQGKISGPEDFEPDVIISWPTEKRWGIKDPQPSPLDKMTPLDGFGVALDTEYDFSLFEKIKNDLVAKNVEDSPPPENTVRKDKYYDKEGRFYTFRDRTFYWFTQLKKTHKGTDIGSAPIGVAFGTVKKDGQDIETGRLVLWKTSASYTYWHIDKGDKQNDPLFTPKIVLV